MVEADGDEARVDGSFLRRGMFSGLEERDLLLLEDRLEDRLDLERDFDRDRDDSSEEDLPRRRHFGRRSLLTDLPWDRLREEERDVDLDEPDV